MENNKKLSEELLKSDGIDPTNIPDTEREMFKAMLDKHLKTGRSKPVLWKIIMKSNITKFTAAAVIILACSISLILWKSTGSGIALADVLTKIEQTTGYMYRLSSTSTKQQNTSKWVRTVFITEDGIKITLEMMDPEKKNKEFLLPQMYLLPHKNTLIAFSHETKTYIRMKFEDTMMESYKEENNDPTAIIKQILSCKHINLGKSVIDGITVEGFQTTDPAYKDGFFGQADLFGETESYEKIDVKIWVDINTSLPIRLEEDILKKDGTHLHKVSSDFRWNVPLDEAGFEPEIPDDYKSAGGVGDLIVPPIDEETAIKGLRIYADLAGDYPDSLDKEIIKKEYQKLLFGDNTPWEGFTANEVTKTTNDIVYPILTLANFYETLVLDEKEPAYYGETVEPGEAEKVLLRWNLDEGKYRVIFGDLSARTVTAEELAELEKQ